MSKLSYLLLPYDISCTMCCCACGYNGSTVTTTSTRILINTSCTLIDNVIVSLLSFVRMRNLAVDSCPMTAQSIDQPVIYCNMGWGLLVPVENVGKLYQRWNSVNSKSIQKSLYVKIHTKRNRLPVH
jgi:hypothetical protein